MLMSAALIGWEQEAPVHSLKATSRTFLTFGITVNNNGQQEGKRQRPLREHPWIAAQK